MKHVKFIGIALFLLASVSCTKENSFFLNGYEFDPSNGETVVLCTTIHPGGGPPSYVSCRDDLDLMEACKWMEYCESEHPDWYSDWTIDGENANNVCSVKCGIIKK